MLINNKPLEFHTFTKKSYIYKEEGQAWQDESSHHCAEQESLSVQERFKWMEITFALRKNEGYMPSGFGGRLFPVDRLAGRRKSR